MASKFHAFNFCAPSLAAKFLTWDCAPLALDKRGKRKRGGPRNVTFIVPRQSRHRDGQG